MKKVVLSISAMLLVGAAAIAQNTSAVAQVGNGNTGTVGQNGILNDSKITQTGDFNGSEVYQGILPGTYPAANNKAEAKQVGDGNAAYISQSNVNNRAYQTQTGDSNSATIWQDQIAPPITALNGGDLATQVQTGKFNKATIDQGTTGNNFPQPVEGFDASQLALFATVPIPFAPNENNEASQIQDGDWNLAYASQGGSENKSWQTQTSPSGTVEADKNISRHFQYGEKNEATTVQNGINNSENTLQIGSLNKSNVTQTNLAGAGNVHVGFSFGNSNNILVNQNGL